MIAAEGVGVDRGGRPVLRGVDVRVRPGELLAVVGPNGSGKSTLVSVLAGDLRPSSGRVTLDGLDLAAHGSDRLARRRAVLAQRDGLSLGLTVAQVVALGRYPHHGRAVVDDAVEAALARFDLRRLRDRPVTALSGGERQRTRAARAVAQLAGSEPGTRVLLADEPTAALDPARQLELLAVCRALADDGVAVLAVLHEINLAALWADRMLALGDGRVVAEGDPASVLTSGALDALFGVPFRVVADAVGRPQLLLSRPVEAP